MRAYTKFIVGSGLHLNIPALLYQAIKTRKMMKVCTHMYLSVGGAHEKYCISMPMVRIGLVRLDRSAVRPKLNRVFL